MKQSGVVFGVLFILSYLTGCTVTREATLRDAHIKGAISLPPVYQAENTEGGRIKIIPHLNYTPAEDIKASVDPTAYSNKSGNNGGLSTNYTKLSKINEAEQMEYTSGGNLTWEIPNISGGLDIELFLSRGFGVTGSYNISSGGSNGSFGLALQSVKNDVGIRLDAGLLFNHFSYEAYSIVEEKIESIFGSSSETYYYHDFGSSNSTNIYISLTFNSTNRENLLGFLLSMGYFRQTVLDYNPGNLDDGYYLLFPPLPIVINNNTRLESTLGYFNILPAICTNINDNIRMTGGVRMNTEIESGSGDVNFWPFIQTEFSF